MFAEFAFKVTGEDRMHCGGMDMTGLPMMWVCFGMDVEQRQGEQPQDHPAAQDVCNPTAFTGANLSCRQHALQTLS